LPGIASTVSLNRPRSPAMLADRSAISIANSVAWSQVTLGMRENRAGRPLTSGVLGAGEGRNSV
jgi:hypothetical protein